jgi:DNA-binding CsgD family transcriptional regulator
MTTRRVVTLLVAAAVAGVVGIGSLFLVSTHRPPSAPATHVARQRPATPLRADVTITAGAGAVRVPDSFLGLSTEHWAIPVWQQRSSVLNSVFSLRHVPGDAPLVLRIGGDSADEAFDLTSDGGLRRRSPDDRELVNSSIEHAIAQRSSFTLEYRAMRFDGRVRTFRSHGDVVVDDTGSAIRLVGVVQNITEMKLAHEALQSTSADLERRAGERQRIALHAAADQTPVPRTPLTHRQLEILQLIAQILTNAAIAERLVMTERTIKWHVKQILAKTGVQPTGETRSRVSSANHDLARPIGSASSPPERSQPLSRTKTSPWSSPAEGQRWSARIDAITSVGRLTIDGRPSQARRTLKAAGPTRSQLRDRHP